MYQPAPVDTPELQEGNKRRGRVAQVDKSANDVAGTPLDGWYPALPKGLYTGVCISQALEIKQ